MVGRPLTDEYDLQRANLNTGQQVELLRSLEEASFGPAASFADDVFLKGFGTSIFFMNADKDEIIGRFGLQPEEEFSQDVMLTGMVDGRKNVEPGTLMFERHAVQEFKTPTMETETIDLTHIRDGQASHVAQVVVTEHALGDVVFTEMRISGAQLDLADLKANIEALHTMLSDARKGPVVYDMDADEITPGSLFGKPENDGQS